MSLQELLQQNNTICNLNKSDFGAIVHGYYSDRDGILKVIDAISFFVSFAALTIVDYTDWAPRQDKIHCIALLVAMVSTHGIAFAELFINKVGTDQQIVTLLTKIETGFRHHVQLSAVLLVAYNLRALMRNRRDWLVELRMEYNSSNILNQVTQLILQFLAGGITGAVSFTMGSFDFVLFTWVSKEGDYLNSTYEQTKRSMTGLFIGFEILPMLYFMAATVATFLAVRSDRDEPEDVESERARATRIILGLSVTYIAKYTMMLGKHTQMMFEFYKAQSACDAFFKIFSTPNAVGIFASFVLISCGTPTTAILLFLKKKHVRLMKRLLLIAWQKIMLRLQAQQPTIDIGGRA